MKTILVPTDFSKAANGAAEYAAYLSKAMKAKVVLLHSYYYPISVSEVPVTVLTAADLEKETERFLKKEAARIKKKTGVDVSCVSRLGFAPDTILTEARKANFIVMGMKGASKVAEALLGSTTTDIIQRSKIPVFVIPEKAEYKKPKKIVFACDYDPRTNAHTLDTLKALITTFKSKIYVVNVKEKRATTSSEDAAAKAKIEKKLKEVEHLYYFPLKENLVDGLNEFINDYQADLLTIVPHRYNFLERLFHKSITKKMAFHGKVPLLTLPDNHRSVPAYFL